MAFYTRVDSFTNGLCVDSSDWMCIRGAAYPVSPQQISLHVGDLAANKNVFAADGFSWWVFFPDDATKIG